MVSPADRSTPLVCHGHSRPVPYVTHSNVLEDGSFYLLSGCLDGRAMLRDGKTGDWIGTFLGHKGAVWSARMNSDVTRVVTASADYTGKLWDCISGENIMTLPHDRLLKTASFAEGDSKVVTGGMEKVVRIYDLNKPEEPEKMALPDGCGTINNSEWIGDISNFSLAAGSAAGTVQLFDVRSSKVLSSDKKYIIATAGKRVCFFTPDKFELVKTSDHPYLVGSATLSPDGTRYVVGGADFYVHVCMFGSGKEIEVHKGHHGPVHSVSYAPDGETYCSSSEDGTLRIWQTFVKEYGLWQYPPS